MRDFLLTIGLNGLITKQPEFVFLKMVKIDAVFYNWKTGFSLVTEPKLIVDHRFAGLGFNLSQSGLF